MYMTTRGPLERLKHYLVNAYYDKKYNIATGGEVEIHHLSTHSSILHAKKYQASNYLILWKLFKSIKIDFSKYTFVDFGCGKGRAMIIAYLLGFKMVRGVELSEDLCDEAKINLKKVIKNEQKWSIENIDARCYFPPLNEEHILFYLYNPFDYIILEGLLDNLKIFLAKKQKKTSYCIYLNPVGHRVFLKKGFTKVKFVLAKNINDIFALYKF